MFTLETESGRLSRSIVLQLALGIAGQLGGLLGWLAGVLSPQAWAITAGVLGTISAIAAIIERTLAGRPVEAGGVRGEPMRRPPGGDAVTRVGLLLTAGVGLLAELRRPRLLWSLLAAAVVLLIAGCSTATFQGANVGIRGRTGPPASVLVSADGKERCEVTGTDGVPLRVEAFDCTKVHQTGGGMCQPPEDDR